MRVNVLWVLVTRINAPYSEKQIQFHPSEQSHGMNPCSPKVICSSSEHLDLRFGPRATALGLSMLEPAKYFVRPGAQSRDRMSH
jgi:hypothetical protein